MEQGKIIEGNILIAEFMGEQVMCSYESFGKTYNSLVSIENIKDWSRAFMKYNSSWDWLMKVVEKIESLGYSVFIQNEGCWMRAARAGMKLPYFSNIKESKIESTFLTIVEFIEWYNKRK